ILALDDAGCTLRIQDKTGNSEISLEDGIIQLKQKAGDITFTATKQVRFDCETFEVHASNNIAFNAGTDITQTFGCMTVDAGSNASWAADGKVDFMSYQKVDGKAAAEVKAAG